VTGSIASDPPCQRVLQFRFRFAMLVSVAQLDADKQSGYGLNPDGELISVFSHPSVSGQGRGGKILAEAVRNGANRLDALGEHLQDFYERHGFTEVGREKNWIAGEEDVIFMERTVPYDQTRYYREVIRGLPPGTPQEAGSQARQGVAGTEQDPTAKGQRGLQEPQPAVTPPLRQLSAPTVPPQATPTTERTKLDTMKTKAQVTKMRDLADRMEPQIESKLHPAVSNQNLTARRSRIAAGMYDEGTRLQEIQAEHHGRWSERNPPPLQLLVFNY